MTMITQRKIRITLGIGALMLFCGVGVFGVFAQDAEAQWRRGGWSHREGQSDFNYEDYDRWRRESSRINSNIENLDDDPVDDLPIPILFGVTLDDLYPNFGDPRDGGSRSHEGFDMLAPLGTPVVSPTEAVVLRTGTGSSAGKYVYTANPGDETFVYMHLDEIADGLESGDELNPGDVIGYVGDTGNASGGPAHLHFEIRENRTAVDPYPRITEEFDLDEKIEFLEEIFDDVDDEDEFAEFLVENFATTLREAQRKDLDLPREIEELLEDIAVMAVPTGDPNDLTIGSQGAAVVSLQQFLINADSGPRADALAAAGATGYFGPITQAALAEYQEEEGIEPASGYYGALTREYIEGEQGEIDGDVVAEVSLDADMPLYDLTIGSQGRGVVWLQAFLIEKESGDATDRLTAAGATGYFGPITQAALAEYQASVGIQPSSGYYGPITQGFILTH